MQQEPEIILVVDDDHSSRAVLRRFFETKGYQVAEAADGPLALDHLRRKGVDLVLLDIVMPGPSGLEVLRELRRTQSLADLPVIMATAKDHTSDIVGALQLGANDYVTRPFDFPVLLARVQTQLALRRRNDQLKEANRRMSRDLQAAARVQAALLPRVPPTLNGASFDWCFQPCVELAGDLLNVVVLDDRRVALYVLDVVGHGVAASLLAVMVHRAIARLLGAGTTDPREIALRLTEEFPWDDRTEQFFTMLFGILDLPQREFRYITAAHPGPIHLPGNGPARVLRTPGMPIALGNGMYQEHVLQMGAADRLFLYSDGLPDAMNSGNRAFSEERVRDILDQSRDVSLSESLGRLLQKVESWCSPAAPHDDISVLAVQLAG